MTNDANKTEIVQFRLTSDQLELLSKAHRDYMNEHSVDITRAEYIRQTLMIACLRQVGIVHLGKETV